VELSEAERRELDECARPTLVTIPGAGHFTMVQEPNQIAAVILKTISANETA
jgi:pimeloyl-ACP methyl ester carboxylesterase